MNFIVYEANASALPQDFGPDAQYEVDQAGVLHIEPRTTGLPSKIVYNATDWRRVVVGSSTARPLEEWGPRREDA